MKCTEMRYESALGDIIESFVALKSGGGEPGANLRQFASSFDRWCARTGATSLDRATVKAYAAERMSGCNPRKRQAWASSLRELARWAGLNGMEGAYVLDASRHDGRPTPYLLTDGEVESFFAQASSYDDGTPMSWQAVAVFGLMCCLGLRNCEVIRMRRRDFDAEALTLDVIRSKGHRSRRLALSLEVRDMLSRCDDRTTACFGGERAPMFVTLTGAAIGHNTISRAFGRIWEAAGLPREKGGAKPTPYAFRHRFAYANIERWWREGADVMSMMPYLQACMGHSSLQSTLWYVHTSPDFMRSFASEVAPLDDVLPEVTFRGQA